MVLAVSSQVVLWHLVTNWQLVISSSIVRFFSPHCPLWRVVSPARVYLTPGLSPPLRGVFLFTEPLPGADRLSMPKVIVSLRHVVTSPLSTELQLPTPRPATMGGVVPLKRDLPLTMEVLPI